MNLDDFIMEINNFPQSIHRFLPGATDKNLQVLIERIGRIPDFLEKLLREFDGAELFISGIPFLTIFRSMNNPPLPAMEWSLEWCVDVYTKKWREINAGSKDIAIAMTNYGGLVLLDEKGKIKEWDTSEGRWLIQNMPITEWFEKIISEGKETLEL